MRYLEHKPKGQLAAYVDRFWYCEDFLSSHSHARERVMPSGCVEVVIALANDWIRQPTGSCLTDVGRTAPSLVVGAFTRYQLIETADLNRMAGIHFLPGGWKALNRVPALCFADQEVPLADLLGGAAARLRCRLLEASAPARIFAVLEEELLGQLQPMNRSSEYRMVRYAVGRLHARAGTGAVASTAAECGLSPKRLTELFRDYVGMTPKRFHRVSRFRAVLAKASEGVRIRHADLAQECGYFDQAHFVRDFQAFSGVTPGAYFQRRGAWETHLLVE